MNYKQKEGLEEQTIEGETILFDVESFKFYELNETMTIVWQHLNTKTVDQISEFISKTYDVSESKAAADVQKATQELEQLKLIQRK